MSSLSKAVFITKYNDPGTGLFRSAKPIEAIDTQALVEDIADSIIFSEDYTEEIGSISSVALLSANSTPIELIAAPGAGKFLIIERIILLLDFATTAYATNTQLEFLVGGGSVVGPIDFFLDQANDKVLSLIPSTQEPDENSALTVMVNDGDPTNGDSPVKFYIKYRTVNF